MEIKLHHIEALICLSLVANAIVNLLKYLVTICVFFIVKYLSICVFCSFLMGYLSFIDLLNFQIYHGE